RQVPTAEQRQRLETLLEAERRHGLDLSRPPALRLVLVRRDEQSYYLVWTWHPLILDDDTAALVLDEVRTVYRGGERELPVPCPFREYVAWAQAQRSTAEAFWREYLAGTRAPAPLPGGGQAAVEAGPDEDHGERKLRLAPELTAALDGLAEQ